MRRLLALAVIAAASPAPAAAQHTPAHAPPSPAERAALIDNARSAAPPSVAAGASVMLFDGTVLHQGTTDWTCFPDDPATPNDSPMCLDAAWGEFVDAMMNRRNPGFTGVGIGYMLQGDMPVSNTDPFATERTATNEWIDDSGPHIMLIVSDPRLLDSLPTDPNNGGPWVMWKGTPYAHVMIPTVPRPR
jgi:hypothetical protein